MESNRYCFSNDGVLFGHHKKMQVNMYIGNPIIVNERKYSCEKVAQKDHSSIST